MRFLHGQHSNVTTEGPAAVVFEFADYNTDEVIGGVESLHLMSGHRVACERRL